MQGFGAGAAAGAAARGLAVFNNFVNYIIDDIISYI